MAESREVYKRVVEIREAHKNEILPKIEQISKERQIAMGFATDLLLQINVNGSGLRVPEGAQKVSIPGASIALRGSKEALVGFGPWNRQASEVKATFSPAAMTKPQTLSLELKGEPKHIEQMLASLHASSFSGIVEK